MASKEETNQWIGFFKDAGLPSNVAVKYALTFAENRIKKAMLLDLNKEYLKEMGITLMGDIISILKHAKDVSEEDARSSVLKDHESIAPKTVLKKSSVSVPASRILDYFTPNESSKPPTKTVVTKKRPIEPAKTYDQYSDEEDVELPKPVVAKKAAPQIRSTAVAKRVIAKTVVKSTAPQKAVRDDVELVEPPKKKVRRVLPEHEGKYKVIMPSGTIPRTQKILSEKTVSSTATKMTVFDRLGDSSVSSTTGMSPSTVENPRITVTGLDLIRPTPQLTLEKFNSSVFARLGNKPMAAVTASTMSTKEVSVKFNEPSLKYAGVLKKTTSSAEPTKKKIIKLVKKKVPITGTMKSDLPEPGMRQRLGVTSSSTVAKVLPVKKTIKLSKPQQLKSAITDQSAVRSGIRNRVGVSSSVTMVSTTKKVTASARKSAVVSSSSFPRGASGHSGNVFTRLGR